MSGCARLLLTLALSLTLRVAPCGEPPGRIEDVQEVELGQMPYLDSVPDPLEGFNRGAWEVNRWLFRGVIYPVGLGYNAIIPKPIRSGITRVGHNLAYPVRLVNSCLQGKWDGAWEETKRFGVNSTLGIGGLFDLATDWKIGRSDEDFGQTLGHYGSGPGFYLMIPLVGPSNGRDALGKIVDWPLDIGTWITWGYTEELWPHFIRAGITGNDLIDNAPAYKRQLDSLIDPYLALRTLYSLNRERLVIDYLPRAIGASNPDPTTGAVLFRASTPDFVDKAVTRRVRVPATGRKLRYSCWIQKKPAPLVYYIPGLGSYREDQSVAAFADLLFRNGYSVVAFSNPFHKEFMERASTMAVPGYTPADSDDIVGVLQLIGRDMEKRYGGRITANYLTGVSHGAHLALRIAAREAAGESTGVRFDGYVAVNPPVSLVHSLERLDDMFNAPLAWPASERGDLMKEAIYKALYFASNGLDVSGDIPLTREESQFLIGLIFRYTLMNTIAESQRREDLGILQNDPGKFVRGESYREIRRISYVEYMNRFVLPYLVDRGIGSNEADLLAATDLTRQTEGLKGNPRIRVQISEDDFLLGPSDIAWFRSTFGDRLTAYPVGGHLGNLHVPVVQEKLVTLFSELGSN